MEDTPQHGTLGSSWSLASASAKVAAGATAAAVIFGAAYLLYKRNSSSSSHYSDAPLAQADDARILEPLKFKRFRLAHIEEVNYNVKLFRFELPDANATLALPPGRHVTLRAPSPLAGENNKLILRPYTPVSPSDTKGHFDLVLKYYEQGRMSRYLHKTAQVGDYIDVRGPTGRFKYKPNEHKLVCLIAGGTGLTPMLALMREMLAHPDEKGQIVLIFQNRFAKDLIMREEIENLCTTHDDQAHAVFVLTRPEKDWMDPKHTKVGVRHASGYVDEDLLRSVLTESAASTLCCTCGPGGFNDSVKEHLTALGFDNLFTF